MLSWVRCIKWVYGVCVFQPKKCLICRAFTYTLLEYYRNNSLSDANLNEYLYDLCTVLAKMHDYECHGMVNIYAVSIELIERIQLQ